MATLQLPEPPKGYLFPLASMITPNIPEAELLTGYSISNKEDMIKAAKKIINIKLCLHVLPINTDLNAIPA